jgi:hypothetical protein
MAEADLLARPCDRFQPAFVIRIVQGELVPLLRG